ncbi:MAG: DNA ligase [Proteobacteria bacterium]|nr:DNA ligase [Pseudomonadota bacterium]
MGSILEDGDDAEVQGSSSTYTLSRKGDVYSCTCPAWRNQSATIDMRTCKHLRAYLGDEVEVARVGSAPATRASGGTVRASSGGGGAAKAAKETAPPVLLAHKWEVEHDPTGWWMSEKLDGVRAYWDGEGFLSRQGNKFYAPDWFVEALPADTLDGELWVGRKMFSRTISIVRSGAMGVDWKNVSYVVFDAPNAKGGFEDRIAHAETVIGRTSSSYVRVLEHVTCDGFVHLREELARVEALGGEGLMLRRPLSKYEVGRSTSLLKVKTFHDAEARVIGHSPGTGKHKGKLGALICELPSGVTFNVGTGFSDAERADPPEEGAVITFRYQELTDDGVPRFPSWVGVRIDAEWPPTSEAKPVSKSAGKATPVAKPLAKVAKGSAGEVVKKANVTYVAAAKSSVVEDADVEADDGDDDDDAPVVVKKAAKKPAPKPVPEDDEAAEDEVAEDDDAEAAKPAPDFFMSLVHPSENKFWEIEVRGKVHYTRFGKIGSPGQTRLTEVGSATAAKSDADKRAMVKRKEGYVAKKKK